MEEVNVEEGQEFASKIKALFAETSAKEDPIGFNNFIIKLLKQYHRRTNNIKNDEKTIVLERKPSKRKKIQHFC
jgi:hypothetical protein